MGSRHSKKSNVNLKVESTLNLKVTSVLLAGINFNNFFKGLITWRISARFAGLEFCCDYMVNFSPVCRAGILL